MQITKRVKTDYKTILRTKVYFLIRKSLWLYLLSMFLIAYAIPLASYNLFISGIIYFLIFLVVILLPAYHFSTIRMARLLNIDADITFNETQIIIRHRNKDLVETKDWNWIKEIIIANKSVILVENQRHQMVFFFDKIT